MANTLPGGLIRQLSPADAGLFRDHLLRLDPQTRRDRFARAVGDAFLEAYADRALDESLVFGFVADGAVRGVAEFCQLQGPLDDEGEAAFTVEAAFRRRGIGGALFRRLVLAGRNRGAHVLWVRCLPHNGAMQALARKHGVRVIHDGDDALGRLEPIAATPFSLWQEALEASLALPVAWMELGQRWSRAARSVAG